MAAAPSPDPAARMRAKRQAVAALAAEMPLADPGVVEAGVDYYIRLARGETVPGAPKTSGDGGASDAGGGEGPRRGRPASPPPSEPRPKGDAKPKGRGKSKHASHTSEGRLADLERQREIVVREIQDREGDLDEAQAVVDGHQGEDVAEEAYERMASTEQALREAEDKLSKIDAAISAVTKAKAKKDQTGKTAGKPPKPPKDKPVMPTKASAPPKERAKPVMPTKASEPPKPDEGAPKERHASDRKELRAGACRCKGRSLRSRRRRSGPSATNTTRTRRSWTAG